MGDFMLNVDGYEFIGYKIDDKEDQYESSIKLTIEDGKLILSTNDEVFGSKFRLFADSNRFQLVDSFQSKYDVSDLIEYNFNETKAETINYSFRVNRIKSSSLDTIENIRKLEVIYYSNKAYFKMKNGVIDFEDENITVLNRKIGNSKSIVFEVLFKQCTSYLIASELIQTIRKFLCVVEGLKFYEESATYTLEDDTYHFDIYESPNYEPNSRRYFFDKREKTETRLDISSTDMNIFLKYWLNKCKDQDSQLARLVEHYHRNDLSNPTMYFKDIFSYYEELAKNESKIKKSYDNVLRDKICEYVDNLDYDEDTKNDYKEKVDLFTIL